MGGNNEMILNGKEDIAKLLSDRNTTLEIVKMLNSDHKTITKLNTFVRPRKIAFNSVKKSVENKNAHKQESKNIFGVAKKNIEECRLLRISAKGMKATK